MVPKMPQKDHHRWTGCGKILKNHYPSMHLCVILMNSNIKIIRIKSLIIKIEKYNYCIR